MNPKKKYSFFLFLIILINFAIVPIILIRADDYDLNIDENTIIEWEITTANEDELEQYFSYSENYDESSFDYEKGDEIKVEISSINEYEDFYYVQCDYYENSEQKGYLNEKVAIDPEDLAEDLAEDYGNSYSIVFICTDTKDYLEEFDEKVPIAYENLVYASGSSIYLNFTLDGYPYCIIIKYDEDGIQEKLKLLKENLEIFEMELQDVTHSDPFSTFLMIFLIVNIIIIIVIIVIVVTVVLIKKKSKKKAGSTPQPIPQLQSIPKVDKTIQSVEIPKEETITEKVGAKIELKYCVQCGSLREKDDKFCPFCGLKY